MTEAEWLTAREPKPLLKYLADRASDRQFRLFVVACCCDGPHVLWNGAASSDAVAVALRYADGLATAEELAAARYAVREQLARTEDMYPGEPTWDATDYTCSADLRNEILWASWYAAIREYAQNVGPLSEDVSVVAVEGFRFQADLLRDIFGNPFRPVAFEPAWRTEAAVGIASKMYDERDFAAMPILADALQEAGCESEDILSHCREPGVHVRGCWVVDLVLGE